MVSFIASVINGLGRSMEDGIISWWDARYFVDAFQKAAPAMKNANEIIGELKDYSDEERTQLINLFAEDCDLPFEKAEEVCEWLFETMISLTKTTQFVKAYKESKVS